MNEHDMRALGRKIRAMQRLAQASIATLDDDALAEVPAEAFDAWDMAGTYKAGQVVAYGNQLHRCIQAHTAQAGWTPDAVPALWRALGVTPGNPGAVPDWVQPTGAHDAYNLGERVQYGGKTWESAVNANVYPPGVVAGQWVEV